MKNGAFTFALLLTAGAVGGVAFVGCGSDEPPPVTVTDAGADVAEDTIPPRDTNPPDTAAPSCALSIDGFSCQPAADRTGKTVCTDEMIDEFMNCFGSSGDTAKCNAAQMKYPQCNTCALSDWLKVDEITGGGSLDIAACMKKVDPTGTCSGVVNCTFDCFSAVCGECDTTAGSGKAGTPASTEQGDCERDARGAGTGGRPKGACYDIAYKDYTACQNDPKFQYCFVRTVADLKFFLRGACRDGGNWSNVTVDKPTDAGVDSGDTGADTAVADTATDDAADAADDAASSD